MNRTTLGFAALIAAGIGAAAPALADVITVYNDRGTFNGAAGAVIVEDFTSTFHFPITTGVLNSETNLPGIGIVPGTIQEGVTYSTPIGSGNFFNIDAGGGYTGGFLDGFNPSDRVVTMDFHNADPNSPRTVRAFGFDLGSLSSTDFDVDIYFSSGPMQHFNFAYPASISFFGFVSDARDITRVVVGNNGGFFGFDFDNFSYDEIGPGGFTLGLSGSCPGTVTVSWSDATPSSMMGIVFANGTGNFTIPGGPCSGTTLGLGSAGLRLVNTISTGSGSGSVNGTAGTAACGHYLQLVVVDGSPCTTSNVAQIR